MVSYSWDPYRKAVREDIRAGLNKHCAIRGLNNLSQMADNEEQSVEDYFTREIDTPAAVAHRAMLKSGLRAPQFPCNFRSESQKKRRDLARSRLANALTHSHGSCASARVLCYASILPNSGCSLRLDRCANILNDETIRRSVDFVFSCDDSMKSFIEPRLARYVAGKRLLTARKHAGRVL